MFKLALDAGHYLGTAGKRCPKELDQNETREWWLNNRVAVKVENLLMAYEDIAILRVDDRTGVKKVSTKDRADAANEWNADFYLSLHFNGTDKIFSGGGIVAFCYGKGSKASFEWRDILYDALIEHTGLKGNRATPKATASYDVVRLTKMPAVLLEMGFMTSRVDCPIILTEKHADKCAAAIVEIIVNRNGLVKKREHTAYTVQINETYTETEGKKIVAELTAKGYPAQLVLNRERNFNADGTRRI